MRLRSAYFLASNVFGKDEVASSNLAISSKEKSSRKFVKNGFSGTFFVYTTNKL